MDWYIPVLIVGGLLILLILIIVGIFNGLVGKRNNVKNAWSQIDVMLKRRYDLIPNLVEVCKGYMAHERGVLENVTAARSAAMKAQGQGAAAQGQAENFLSSTLKSLFAVVENYPDLKANQNMLALQEELTSTENKISYSRQHYNDTVTVYNNATEMFPSNVIAGMFSFQKAEFFVVENAEERKAPQVKF